MQVNQLVLAFLGFLCCTATAFPEYKEGASDHAASFSPKHIRKSFPKRESNLDGASDHAATFSPKHIRKPLPKRQSTFDAASQEVSTTGQYAWEAPNFAKGDQRGPCPGLNALANHGYLPHNGVSDVTTMVNAVNTGKFSNPDSDQPLLTSHSLWNGPRLWQFPCCLR